jgi:archaemetzincin
MWKCCLIVLLAFTACQYKKGRMASCKSTQPVKIILQPFEDISPQQIAYLQKELPKWYNASIVIKPAINLPNNAWYQPRKRYISDSLLGFLNKRGRTDEEFIAGITTKDISTQKGNIRNYGIMGQGLCPGNVCIISTHRLARTKEQYAHINARLLKVVIHELGHNFGLPHCPNQSCIMVDAEGKDKLPQEKDLCPKCRSYLSQQGFLPVRIKR